MSQITYIFSQLSYYAGLKVVSSVFTNPNYIANYQSVNPIQQSSYEKMLLAVPRNYTPS
jgi:hypothetical protein